MKDKAVTNDFFSFLLENNFNDEEKISFSLDDLIDIFPLIDTLISSKYEPHKKNGLNASKKFLAFFKEVRTYVHIKY